MNAIITFISDFWDMNENKDIYNENCWYEK